MSTEVKARPDGTVTSVHIPARQGADDSGALAVSERMRKTSLGDVSKKSASGKAFPKRVDYDSQEDYLHAMKVRADNARANPIKAGQREALRKQ